MYTREDKRAIAWFTAIVVVIVMIPLACGERRMGYDDGTDFATELDEYHERR